MAESNIEHTTRYKEIRTRRQICEWPLTHVLPLILLLAAGCQKTKPAAPAPQPAAVPVSTPPPAPTKPVPTFSAAQTIGMFVYPKTVAFNFNWRSVSELFDVMFQD
jgi:hypothetical protein